MTLIKYHVAAHAGDEVSGLPMEVPVRLILISSSNRSHAKIRALGEQAMAILKTWRLLRKLRCTALVQAVLTLHLNASH